MKPRRICLLLLAFLLLATSAQAETWYVYKGAVAATKAATLPDIKSQHATTGEGKITVRAVGASIAWQEDGKNRFSAVSYDTPVSLQVTADLPKGKALSYWVIDGVRYDFKPKAPTQLTLENVTANMTVEAVAKGKNSQTLLTAQDIQAQRTGDELTVKTVHAKLCHVRSDLKGAGGWMTAFDFTRDYVNRATKRAESGGQVTVRVKATIPSGKKISCWKFDGVTVTFDTNVTEMVVRALNVSRTYEPVFVKLKQSAKKESSTTASKLKISCAGCRFSGGGHQNVSSGSVEPGTTIRLNSSSGSVMWKINGHLLTKKSTVTAADGSSVTVETPIVTASITRTLYSTGLTVECVAP